MDLKIIIVNSPNDEYFLAHCSIMLEERYKHFQMIVKMAEYAQLFSLDFCGVQCTTSAFEDELW
jgi:hypothetical protein